LPLAFHNKSLSLSAVVNLSLFCALKLSISLALSLYIFFISVLSQKMAKSVQPICNILIIWWYKVRNSYIYFISWPSSYRSFGGFM